MRGATNQTGISLDISNIEPGLMVCSCPVVSTYRLWFRNSLGDLVAYLNHTFGVGCWRIYNLKVEETEADYKDTDLWMLLKSSSPATFPKTSLHKRLLPRNQYPLYSVEDSTEYNEQVSGFNGLEIALRREGWVDHCPPPFLLLQEIIDDMHRFLTERNNHICVVHCKMGKGRSGTVCIAYLMKYRKMSLREAGEKFAKHRFKSGVTKGVTIKSQLRYLKYQEKLISLTIMDQIFFLDTLRHPPHWNIISITVTNPSRTLLVEDEPCYLYLRKYNYDRTGFVTLEVINLTHHIIKSYIKENEETKVKKKITSFSLGILESPISLTSPDLMLQFEMSMSRSFMNKKFTIYDRNTPNSSTPPKECNTFKNSYSWINCLCEQNNKQNLIAKGESENKGVPNNVFTVTLNWEDIDSVKGSKRLGISLFECIQLHISKGVS